MQSVYVKSKQLNPGNEIDVQINSCNHKSLYANFWLGIINLKTTKIKSLTNRSLESSKDSTVLNIENSHALDIFGINNENLDFIEQKFPLKLFQKGNQLHIKGEKKFRNLLRNTIFQTLEEIKNKKIKSKYNLMQENIKMSLINDTENIKKLAVAKTTKCDITGKSKNQNDYLEILQKKTNYICGWACWNW